jgi:tetratricopeptide (TPR) repeat protein
MSIRRFSLLVALAIAGSASAKPQPAPAPPPPVPPAAAAPAAPTAEEHAAAFAAADAASDPATKADLLLAITDDPSKAPFAGEAWARLGVILDQADLDIAAMHAWARAIALDPSSMAPLAGLAMDLTEKTSDAGEIGAALAASSGMAVDPATRSRIAEIGGRWSLQHDNLGPAGGMLLLGDPNQKNWPEVAALQGIVMAAQGRPNDAIAPLQDAIKTGMADQRDERWLRSQQMNLGRAYYAAGNYGMAIYQFAEIPRDSDWWVEAQFERAWTHFRADDMRGTIAMLMTLQSPFFQDWYYPEADLLRAYSLFMMCKFPDAKKEVDAFEAKYRPLAEQLQKVGPSLDANATFADVVAMREGNPTQLPASILRPYVHDDRFTDAIAFVAEADKELGSSALAGSRVASSAKEWITARRTARIAEESARVHKRVDAARGDLTDMLQGVKITGVDITTLEADLYEKASATGTLDFGDPMGRLRSLKRDKKGYEVWPFQGEYWADELGWYQVDARPDCPEKMAVGPGAAPPK